MGAPVADDGFADSDVAPSGDTLPEDTSALGQSAFDPPQSSGAGDGLGPAPELSDPATGGTGPAASSGGEEAPLVLGAVQNPLSAPRSESSLLYLVLVLVLGGLGAFVGAQVFSRFGVLLNLRESTLAGP